MKSFIILAFILLFNLNSYCGNQDGITLNQEALDLLSKGKFEQSIGLFKEALEEMEHPVIKSNLANAWNSFGLSQMKESKWEDAENSFENALQIDDQKKVFYYNLASVKQVRKEFSSAIDTLLEGVDLEDEGINNSLMRVKLGELYIKTEDFSEAIYHLERVDKNDQNIQTARNRIAESYYLQGDVENAIFHWEELLKDFPETPDKENIKQYLQKAKSQSTVEKDFLKDRSRHFIIRFAEDKQVDQMENLLEMMEEAYSTVGKSMGAYPQNQVEAIVYSKKADFREVTQGPEWSGGIYSEGRIRIPLKGAIKYGTRGILFHEYTHLLVHILSKGTPVPLWVNEGLAEYHNPDVWNKDKEDMVIKAVKEGKIFSLTSLVNHFYDLPDVNAIYFAYTEAYLAVKFLLEDYSDMRSMLFFIEKMSEGQTYNEALRSAFFLTPEELDQKFMNYLEENYK